MKKIQWMKIWGQKEQSLQQIKMPSWNYIYESRQFKVLKKEKNIVEVETNQWKLISKCHNQASIQTKKDIWWYKENKTFINTKFIKSLINYLKRLKKLIKKRWIKLIYYH